MSHGGTVAFQAILLFFVSLVATIYVSSRLRREPNENR